MSEADEQRKRTEELPEWLALDDKEGQRIPEGIPELIDAHVHLFPDRLFEAIWRWFDAHAWPIRYKQTSSEVLDFLRAKGVKHIVGLCYSHKAGLARGLNEYMAALVQEHSDLTGLATVHPEDSDPALILKDAFSAGLSGVKLHCHVQVMSANDERLDAVYSACCDYDQPLVIHAGREPRSEAYPRDPHEFCEISCIEDVLIRFPNLRICVPHLGADEEAGYMRLTERYDNLWLDTTMMLSNYFPTIRRELIHNIRPDRLMYGTDFPNLPYAWDRELRWLVEQELPVSSLEMILGSTARGFYGIEG